MRSPDESEPVGEAGTPAGRRLLAVKRVSIAAATAFLAVNLWTGAPIVALWVGAQTVGTTTLSMQAVIVVLLVLGVLLFLMAAALAWLTSTYHALTGHRGGEQRVRWLRSMNTQADPVGGGAPISMPERIVMVSVCIAVVTFLIWFFFLAGSPLPSP